jgi:hypothetical protein
VHVHRRWYAPGRPGSGLALALSCLAAGLPGCEHPTEVREVATTPPASPVRVARRAITSERITTYEGSGQVVHPDVVYTPPGAFAHVWHLVLTPYPVATGSLYENPSVYYSDDGIAWTIEPGVVNPLARPRPSSNGEALSDPALVYVSESHELWLYYRSYTRDSDDVWVLRTPDAVHWSSPDLVLATPSGQALSPSVVHRGPGDWLMWTVSGHCGDGGSHVELRRSADGLQWSAPQAVALDSLSPWHVFVRWVASLGSWVLVTNVKDKPSECLTSELYVAFSSDGVTWTHGAHPWLAAGDDSLGLFTSVVYRSAFAEVGDSLRFWYSGASNTLKTYICHKGQMICSDSILVWGGLGTEMRSATDVRAAAPVGAAPKSH